MRGCGTLEVGSRDAELKEMLPMPKEDRIMRARFMMEDPDNIDATLKITMPLKNWVSFRDELPTKTHLQRYFRSVITDLIAQARKVFYSEHEAE